MIRDTTQGHPIFTFGWYQGRNHLDSQITSLIMKEFTIILGERYIYEFTEDLNIEKNTLVNYYYNLLLL